MHDVTEGGVLGAILEMAQASGCGVCIDSEALPIGEAQRQITALFRIDPRFCVGAGSMVMAVQKGKEDALLKHLQASHIKATVVGEFASKDEGHIIIENGEEHPLLFSGRDPYWEAFFKAYNANWT